MRARPSAPNSSQQHNPPPRPPRATIAARVHGLCTAHVRPRLQRARVARPRGLGVFFPSPPLTSKPLPPSLSIHPFSPTTQVSVLSYGAWVTFGSQVGVDAAKQLMQQARDAGVNLCVD